MARAKVTGIEQVKSAMRDAGGRGPEFLSNALGAEVFQIFAESQGIVPVDTGRLRASGIVREFANLLLWKITYGTVYALPVHGGISGGPRGRGAGGRFTKGAAGFGGVPFLKRPFDAAKKGMLSRLAKAVRAQIKTGAFR